MKKSIIIKRFTVGSQFKIVAVGCSFALVGFAIVMGIFALFGADTLRWNGGSVKSIEGLLASPFIGLLLAAYFTVIAWIVFVFSFWIFSRFGRLRLDYITDEPESPTGENVGTVRMSGKIAEWPNKDLMTEIMQVAGLRVQEGCYTIIGQGGSHFLLEGYGDELGDPAIAAIADSVENLTRDGRLVSEVLARAGIRHRFEIFDSCDNMVDYLHHDWPLDSRT